MKKPIWILLDSQGVGGIESHVINLTKGLIDSGYAAEIIFLQRYGDHPLTPVIEALNIPCTFLSGGLDALRNALRAQPRLLHTHGYKAGILGRIAARAAGIPVVSTFHAGEPGVGRVRLYDTLDRWTAFLAPAIAVSDAIAQRIPVASQQFKNFVTVPATMASHDSHAIGFVGRFSHEKGADRFCAFANSYRDAPFIAFGDGPMLAPLREQYGALVNFVGAVPSMTSHWEKMSRLCMPSRHEGLPMAALEAMARGIPVIASKVGALPQLIVHQDNGWLVDTDDDTGFIAALKEWDLLTDDQQAQMRLKARATIVDHYSPEAIVPNIVQFYATHFPTAF